MYFKLYVVWHDSRTNAENNQSASRKEELKYSLKRDKRKGIGKNSNINLETDGNEKKNSK